MSKITFPNKSNFSRLENYDDETKIISAQNVNEIKNSVNVLYDNFDNANTTLTQHGTKITELETKAKTYDRKVQTVNELSTTTRQLQSQLTNLSHEIDLLKASAGFRPKLVYRGSGYIKEAGTLDLTGALQNWNHRDWQNAVYVLTITLHYEGNKSFNHSQMFSRSQITTSNSLYFIAYAGNPSNIHSNTSLSFFSISNSGILKHEHDGSLYANDDKWQLDNCGVYLYELL
ncbi:hypothetical protein NXS15_01235 [Mycoplasma sp. CSL7475-4]|uniref:hypothetical protein n=1 Tax=Mycoplasma sp. CSL7475-4 TaxID=2973942 RepID=UPI00216B6279|nr:hypothetical protein [Mycoplasma sp. CSL7475-4]MCS4536754.1 hypothetical protein [Mycoplasma sp. CSL7475-4]